MHFQALVIGGGAAGLSAAIGLQVAGVSVLCVAPLQPPPALLAAAGMLLPALDDFSTPIQRAADWSYQAWPQFAKELNLGASFQSLEVVHFSGDEPAIVGHFRGHVVQTQQLYRQALAKVQAMVRDVVMVCEFRDKFFQVTTASGDVYTCEHLIMATGFSNRVPECRGFSIAQSQLPRSVRGITVRLQFQGLTSILYWKKDPRTVVYIAPWPDGTVVVGSTITIDDAQTEWRVQEEAELMAHAVKLLPDLVNAKVCERRVGFRPLSSGREPGFASIVAHGNSQAWWINGLFRNGVLWMPACAALPYQLLQGETVDPDLMGLVRRD